MKEFIENPYQIVHRIEAWETIPKEKTHYNNLPLVGITPEHEGITFNNLNLNYEIPIVGDECLGLFKIFEEIFDGNDSDDSSIINAWANYNCLTKSFRFTNVTENEFLNYKELGFKVLSVADLLIEAVLGPETQKVS